jgi:hypothetical protein
MLIIWVHIGGIRHISTSEGDALSALLSNAFSVEYIFRKVQGNQDGM